MARAFDPADCHSIDLAKRLQGIGYKVFNLKREPTDLADGLEAARRLEALRTLADEAALAFNELIRRERNVLANL